MIGLKQTAGQGGGGTSPYKPTLQAPQTLFGSMAVSSEESKEGGEGVVVAPPSNQANNKATPFTALRKIATLHGYKEVHYNSQTAKIAFEKEEEIVDKEDGDDDDEEDDSDDETTEKKVKKIRINVYFTTGTVSGMVHLHDEIGGTIQFWTYKRPTKKEMISIFQDPMINIEGGDEEYFYSLSEWRAGGPSVWSQVFKTPKEPEYNDEDSKSSEDEYIVVGKEDEDDDDEDDNDGNECDDSRRWKYVQAVTNFCTYEEVCDIAVFCEMWNKLRYGKGYNDTCTIPTSRGAFESLSEVGKIIKFCNAGCGICGQDKVGSFCSLGRILCEVALDTDPDTLVPILSYSIGSSDAVDADAHPMDNVINCECEEGNLFVDTYGDELHALKRKLMSFPEYYRRELIQFYFQKLMHSYTLLVKLDDEEEGEENDDSTPPKYSTYKAHFLQNAIRAAHVDYGEMYYDPSVKCQCFCHGCR